MTKTIKILLLFIYIVVIPSETSKVKDSEIKVKLQFLEYDLEDFCKAKNDAKWKFFNGTEENLKQVS